MIVSANESVCYCLDYYSPLLVSEIVLEWDPDNPRKKKIKSIATFWNNPVTIIGKIEVEFNKSYPLHDFGSPITDKEMMVGRGRHQLQLVNIDVPKHKVLRNIDLVLMPGTHFGLAFGGLVTIINRQHWEPRSSEEIEQALCQVQQVMFHATRQLKLPFGDSS
jgi:hypothetical protein